MELHHHHQPSSSQSVSALLHHLGAPDLTLIFAKSRLLTRYEQYFQRVLSLDALDDEDNLDRMNTEATEYGPLFRDSVVMKFTNVFSLKCRTVYP